MNISEARNRKEKKWKLNCSVLLDFKNVFVLFSVAILILLRFFAFYFISVIILFPETCFIPLKIFDEKIACDMFSIGVGKNIQNRFLFSLTIFFVCDFYFQIIY